MKSLSTQLRKYSDRQIKTNREIYEENRRNQNMDTNLSIGDQVSFVKKDFARCRIIGAIKGISGNTIHVKTEFSIGGIKEFYLNISEVQKYDPTSNSK